MKYVVFFALLATWGVQSQSLVRQTLGSSGASLRVNVATERYFLWQSIGQESVIRSFTADLQRLQQGFIQPLGPPAFGEAPFGLPLTFYPNPFTDQIHIDLEREPAEGISVSMFDMLGRQVLQNNYDNTQRITLDTRTLSAGGYLLTVSSGARRNVKQLIRL